MSHVAGPSDLFGRGAGALRTVASTALHGLSRYPLRTGLSMLSVALGVAAVVSMVAVGAGARTESMRQVSQLGLQNVVIRYQSPPQVSDMFRGHGLFLADARRLAVALEPLGSQVSPLNVRTVLASAGGRPANAMALAVDHRYFTIMSLRVPYGRPLSALDDERAARVCVLGATIARQLLGGRQAVGSTVTLGGEPYTVVGVLGSVETDDRPIGSISPRPFEQVAFVPWTTLMARGPVARPDTRVDEVWIRAADAGRPDEIAAAAARVLQVAKPGRRDYEVVVPRELAVQQARLRRTFDSVVGSIALVTLVVGGIGVTNVMLMSVLERTAEIGLRRSVGATRRAIASEFLGEAIAICMVGGLIGLAVGGLTASSIGRFGQWPTELSSEVVGAALAVSIGAGLLSGWYPARRASRLNPIDAVRYE